MLCNEFCTEEQLKMLQEHIEAALWEKISKTTIGPFITAVRQWIISPLHTDKINAMLVYRKIINEARTHFLDYMFLENLRTCLFLFS